MWKRLGQKLARGHIPKPGHSIAATGHNGLAVGAKSQGIDRTWVWKRQWPAQTLSPQQGFAFVGFLAAASGPDDFSVGMKGHGKNNSWMRQRLANGLPGGSIPKLGFAPIFLLAPDSSTGE